MRPSQEPAAVSDSREAWPTLLQLAAQEAFEIMLGSKLERIESDAAYASEITGMVGLAGQVCGVFTLRCGTAAARLMACRMLGVEDGQADDLQMWDAVGEICNMVAGNFKNKVTGLSDRCLLSVPTVITGENYSFHSLADSGAVEFVMSFESHPLLLALELHT